MPGDLNKLHIVGRLTADPVGKMHRRNGNLFFTFYLATNNRWQAKKGQSKGKGLRQTSFIGCCMFGRRAPAMLEVLKKGDKVLITGSIRSSARDYIEDIRRKTVWIFVETIEILSGRTGDEGFIEAEEAVEPEDVAVEELHRTEYGDAGDFEF